MNTKPIYRFAALPLSVIAVMIIALGCASSKAPDDWLPAPKDVPHDVYGGWLNLKLDAGANRFLIQSGEFIAVRDSTVILISQEGKSLIFPMPLVRRATLELHQKETGQAGLATLGGVLSTLSHGFYLLISAPIWLITGTGASSSVSHIDHFETDNPSIGWWYDHSKYARFPQGVPENIDLAALKSKPYSQKK
jgi:hypothetical protein